MDFLPLRGRLLRTLSYKYRHVELAVIEDAVSEAFYCLLATNALELMPEQQFAYLHTTAERLLFREHRRTQREPLINVTIAATAVFETLMTDDREMIEHAISQLTPTKRAIVYPKLFEQIPLHVVAESMDKKIASVQKAYTRALREMRRIIKRENHRGERWVSSSVC